MSRIIFITLAAFVFNRHLQNQQKVLSLHLAYIRIFCMLQSLRKWGKYVKYLICVSQFLAILNVSYRKYM